MADSDPITFDAADIQHNESASPTPQTAQAPMTFSADEIQHVEPTPAATPSVVSFSPEEIQNVESKASRPTNASFLTAPDGPTSIGPASPSIWERLKSVFEKGMPAFNPEFETASHFSGDRLPSGKLMPQMQIVTPEAAMTETEQKKHPIVSGVGEIAGSLTSPGSVATIAATGGLGEIGGAAGKIVPRLISAGFSAQTLYGAARQVPEVRDALKTGDYSTAENLLTKIILEGGLAALGVRHAATGKGAVTGKADSATVEPEVHPVPPESSLGQLIGGQEAPAVHVVPTDATKMTLEAEHTVTPESKAETTGETRTENAQPTAKVVSSGHVPVVSRSEVLTAAIQRIVDNSDALQKIGVDPQKIQTVDDVADQLNGAAAQLKQDMDPRIANSLTFDMQKQLASDLGMQVEDLLSRKVGSAFNAEEVTAARAMLKASQTHVLDLARQATNDEIPFKDFTNALAQHKAVLDVVKGTVAREAGRALGAFRIAADDLPQAKIADLMSKLDPAAQVRAADLLSRIDPSDNAAVNKFIQEITPASTSDKVFEAFQNALLSSPRTAIIKSASDATMLFLDSIGKLTAGVIAKGKSLATGEAPERYPLEAWSFGKGAARAIGQAGRVLLGQDDLPGFEQHGRAAIKGTFGKIVRVPMTVLSRITDAAHTLNYAGQIEALSYRQAMAEGLKGQDLEARQSYLAQNPTPQMRQQAFDFARKQTFQARLGPIGAETQKWIRTVPVLRYVVPFFKTPANIVKTAGEFSPYGLAKGIASSDVDLQARGAIGSAIAAAVTYHALQNNITGGGPIQPQQKFTLEATGWQPYSIKIGDKYFSYNRLEPLGMILGLTADLAHAIHSGTDPESSEVKSRADHIQQIISRNIENLPFVYSLSNLMSAFQPDNKSGVQRFIDRQIADIIPAGVASLAQGLDPTVRRPENLPQYIEARVPGMTRDVPPAMDISGQPVQRPANALGGANPFPISTERKDPVVSELARLGETAEHLPATVTEPRKGLHLKRSQKAPRETLAEDEARTIQQQDERQLHAFLTAIVNSDSWKQMTDAEKKSLIKHARSEITRNRWERLEELRKATVVPILGNRSPAH